MAKRGGEERATRSLDVYLHGEWIGTVTQHTEESVIETVHRGGDTDTNAAICGFAKSGRENLRRDELAIYRLLADEYLSLDDAGLKAARATGAIIEVNCDDQAIQE